jgi:hypothetical protein
MEIIDISGEGIFNTLDIILWVIFFLGIRLFYKQVIKGVL